MGPGLYVMGTKGLCNLLQDLEGLVEEQGLGGYVLVEKQDVLDAIGTFVAAYLATVPEAQNMKPAELQQALSSTFRVRHCCLVHTCVDDKQSCAMCEVMLICF